MFHIIPDNFFVPLSSPNRIVYWECISRLFAIMEHQFSFGVEREVLVDELEFYFGQENAAQLVEEEFQADDSRSRANGILRRLEYSRTCAATSARSFRESAPAYAGSVSGKACRYRLRAQHRE